MATTHNIASFFLRDSEITLKIIKLVNETPNDMDLGKAVRSLILNDDRIVKGKYVQNS